jgi:hypothetical protein
MTEPTPHLSPEKAADLIRGFAESLSEAQCRWLIDWLADDGREIQRTLIMGIALARDHAPA